MSRKKYAALALVVALGMFTGCGDKVDVDALKAENESLLETVIENEDRIAELERMLGSVNGDSASLTAITEVEDGSGRETFVSIDGKILFEGELQYTGASQAPNTAKLNLSNRVSIIPSNNWIVQMNGTTTKYSHPNGIYGTIKLSTVPELIKAEDIEDTILTPFTDTIPYTSISNSKIYIEDVWRGMATEMTILNNGKPAVIRCGVLGYADIGLSYCFYYDGDRDSTKTELIDNIMKSVKFGELQMRIE